MEVAQVVDPMVNVQPDVKVGPDPEVDAAAPAATPRERSRLRRSVATIGVTPLSRWNSPGSLARIELGCFDEVRLGDLVTSIAQLCLECARLLLE